MTPREALRWHAPSCFAVVPTHRAGTNPGPFELSAYWNQGYPTTGDEVWIAGGLLKLVNGLGTAGATAAGGAVDCLAAPNATTLKLLKNGVDVEIAAGTTGIRSTMSRLTTNTGNEVALLRMANGRRILRMGGQDYVDLYGGVERIIAHTHPSGRLAFSPADLRALTARGQGSSVIIDALADLAARLLIL